MKISKIIFTLRKSSGVPFFSLKIFIEKSVRAPLVTMRKNFLLKKNVFQYVPTTYQNLKKNLLWFQKYLGKTDYFFKIQHPVSFNRRPFGPMFIGTFFLILVSSIVWHYAMYFFLCHPVYVNCFIFICCSILEKDKYVGERAL